MRPFYRTWLEFTCWLGGIVLWLFLMQGHWAWWQPLTLWLIFTILFLCLKKLGYGADSLPLVALLISVGWIFLYRLDPKWATSQFWGTIIAVCAYLIGLWIPFLQIDKPLLWISGALGLLALTLIFGVRIGGAKAWLVLGPLQFQPVELARIFLVIYLARHLHEQRSKREMYFVLGLFFLLLACQKDLGPALLVFFVFCCLSLYVEFSWIKLFAYLGTAFLGFMGALFFFPHLRTRVLAWIWPWDHFESQGYQVLQGLFALRAGGVVGRGLGEGLVQVIPEVHTDYLFTVIGEEFGLIGTFSLILVYLALAFWAIHLLSEVENGSERVIGLGLVLLLHGQVFLVVGGILRLLPFTGMTLPFLSFGSSSLVAQFWMLGMLTGLRREPS